MSVNKVILVGNAGKDCELRYTPSGTAVGTFSLATSERFKDREGQQQEKTEWHNIVAWRNLAEICGKFVTKGKQVYIEGKIQTRSYEDRDGNKRYMTEIVADQMTLLGGRPQNDEGGQRDTYQGQRQDRPAQGQQRSEGGGYNHQNEPPCNPDDDIPFAHRYDWLERTWL